MAEENGLEKLLRQMPVDQAGDDLIPTVHAAIAAARRRARWFTRVLWAGLASFSIISAIALVPRLTSLWELVPSDWAASAASWWQGLEASPVESFKSMALQLWSIPNVLAQSLEVEIVLGGLVALLLSWLTFKIILTGQTSRKAVLQ